MNKVYKVVWSKVRNCYVVVSELAKNHTKNVRSGLAGGRALSVLLISALLCTPASFVQATIDDGAACIKVDSKLHGTATADGNGIALGEGASVKNSSGNSTAIGNFTTVDGEGSIAIGSGWETYADPGNAHYRNGNMPRATVKGSNSMAIGNAETVVAGNNNIAVGAGSQVGIDKEAWERDYTVQASATGVANGTAVGSEAKVSGNQGSAVGFNAQARGKSAVAMGVKALATGESSVAAGNEAKAFGAQSIALGDGADAEDDHAMAIGNTASAKGQDSMAIGNQTTTDGNSSLAVGNQAAAIGDYSMAQGIMAYANGTSSLAVGEQAIAMADYSVALGSGAYVGVSDGVALGSMSESNRKGGISGYDPLTNKTSEENTSVWKSNLGAASVGNTMMASGEVSTRQIIGVAAGSEDTDAVNVAQLKALNTKIEARTANSGVHYYSVGEKARLDEYGYEVDEEGNRIQDDWNHEGDRNYYYQKRGKNASVSDDIPLTSNYENEGATGVGSLAAGTYAWAVERAVAIGNAAGAGEKGAIAIGDHASTQDPYLTDHPKKDKGLIAIGRYARAYSGFDYDTSDLLSSIGTAAVALGTGADAYGGVAIGEQAHVDFGNGVSIGRKSQSGGIDAVALGNGAKAGEAYWPTPQIYSGGYLGGNHVEASTGDRAVAIGKKANALPDDAIAIGTNAVAGSIDDYDVSMPSYITSGERTIAMGKESKAMADDAIALGSKAQALTVGGRGFGHKQCGRSRNGHRRL